MMIVDFDLSSCSQFLGFIAFAFHSFSNFHAFRVAASTAFCSWAWPGATWLTDDEHWYVLCFRAMQKKEQIKIMKFIEDSITERAGFDEIGRSDWRMWQWQWCGRGYGGGCSSCCCCWLLGILLWRRWDGMRVQRVGDYFLVLLFLKYRVHMSVP